MRELAGRTAVVTGAATGIGAALSAALAVSQMRVVLADLDPDALAVTSGALAARGSDVRAVVTDVSDAASVENLAAVAKESFGPVHLLVNNAGILRPGSTFEQALDDWHAVLGVNVLGIVHGLRSFVPGMLAHGEPCHVLNTASVGGLLASAHMAAYIASKHAAVAISECLALEVAGTNMGVTVLCPGGVATNIYRSEAQRRAEVGLAAPAPTEEVFSRMAAPDRSDQATPDEVAAIALEAIRAGRLHAVAFSETHRATVRGRFETITQAMEAYSAVEP